MENEIYLGLTGSDLADLVQYAVDNGYLEDWNEENAYHCERVSSAYEAIVGEEE